MSAQAAISPVSPRSWARSLSGPPKLSSDGTWPDTLIRWWRDVEPDIIQPSLNHHYLTMHLGGAKRVKRCGEGRTEVADIPCGALSIVPAGAAFEWSTRGPVEFAHLYLSPQTIERVSDEEFECDPATLGLQARLGVCDPLLQALFLTMLDELALRSAGSRLYLDTLLHALILRLLRAYAGAPAAPLRARHAMAPVRLRRVLDFVEANLAHDIRLADLAGVAALSPFHFSRAFASETGRSPYAHVVQRRIERAKVLLSDGCDPVATVAAQCGFHSAGQFARMFKRATGQSPLYYRH